MIPYDPNLSESTCQKCGYAHGGLNSKRVPRFEQRTMDGQGVLEWPCDRCGHVIVTSTADAPAISPET